MDEEKVTTETLQIREDLVAYLDGELSPAERDRVEQRLSEDDRWQKHLRELERSWDLLDELPRAEVDESFTRDTMESIIVKLAAPTEARTIAGQRPPRLIVISLLATFLLAGLVGFATIRSRAERENRRVIQDFAIIENMDAYHDAGSIEMLRRLSQTGQFKPVDVQDDPPQSSPEVRIRSLSEDERLQLMDSRRRLHAMSPANRSRLQHFHTELSAAADRELLQGTMREYSRWLNTLHPAQRAEFVAPENSSELFSRIQETKSLQDKFLVPMLASGFPRQDVEILVMWLRIWITDNEDRIIGEFPEYLQRSLPLISSDLERHEQLVYEIMRRMRFRTDDGLSDDIFPTRDEVEEVCLILSLETADKLRTSQERGDRDLYTIYARLLPLTIGPPLNDRWQSIARFVGGGGLPGQLQERFRDRFGNGGRVRRRDDH